MFRKNGHPSVNHVENTMYVTVARTSSASQPKSQKVSKRKLKRKKSCIKMKPTHDNLLQHSDDLPNLFLGDNQGHSVTEGLRNLAKSSIEKASCIVLAAVVNTVAIPLTIQGVSLAIDTCMDVHVGWYCVGVRTRSILLPRHEYFMLHSLPCARTSPVLSLSLQNPCSSC